MTTCTNTTSSHVVIAVAHRRARIGDRTRTTRRGATARVGEADDDARASASEDVKRHRAAALSKAKTGRKGYKARVSGRANADDVERASRGEKTKEVGVVEGETPYRLGRAEREEWTRAKTRMVVRGSKRGGVLEIESKRTSAFARHGHPLINTHRLWCDAQGSAFIVNERDQSGAGADEIVVDLSPLRVDVDLGCRNRLFEIARAIGGDGDAVAVEDCCGGEEPVDALKRYIEFTELDSVAEASTSAVDDAVNVIDPASISPEALAEAEAAVAEAARRVRALKDGGASNADDAVKATVAVLLDLKLSLANLRRASSSSTMNADAVDAAADVAASDADTTAETERLALRSLSELPIYALPERIVRFKCRDRAVAKSLAKAFANDECLVAAK